MDRPPKVLSVACKGSHEFPRHFVHDQFGRVWDGRAWSRDERKALLYLSANSACEACHHLLMVEYTGRPKRRFKAPVYLDLFTDKDIAREDVINWLVRVCRLFVDAPQH